MLAATDPLSAGHPLGVFGPLMLDAVDIWRQGGWAMIAIAAVAVVMFGLGVSLQLRFLTLGFGRVPDATWRRWIEEPRARRGAVGCVLDSVLAARDHDDLTGRFRQVEATELRPIRRTLKLMQICVSAAPLLGLLGTVTGMLATFGALATGSGGDKTMSMVAGGISEALITTETGLVIALPGLFFQYILARQFDRAKVRLARMETVCAQYLHRQGRIRRRRPTSVPAPPPPPPPSTSSDHLRQDRVAHRRPASVLG